jgi:hypothetical protein
VNRSFALAACALLLAGCGWHGLRVPSSDPPTDPPTDGGPATAAEPIAQESPPPAATAPPSSALDWKPNPIRRTQTGVSLFSGTVTNTDTRWSVKDVQVELKLVDAGGAVIQVLYGHIQDLRPGDKGDYTITIPANVKFELSNLRLMWTWFLS